MSQASTELLGSSVLVSSILGGSAFIGATAAAGGGTTLLSIDSNLAELSGRHDSVRSPRLAHTTQGDSIRFAAHVVGALKPKSPRLKTRGVGVVDISPSNRQQEITATEKKIEEAKADLESKLYLLRTQITRIEELERQVELGSIQLQASRRRREEETSDLESQRRVLQAQLERQLADNRNMAAQFAATRLKNEGMNKGIRAQVVSLAETFSPRWAGQDVRNLIRATAETNGDDDEGMSPEEEAEALRSVLDLRSPEQRLDDVVRWKTARDAEDRERAARAQANDNAAKLAAEEESRAAEFERRMATLQGNLSTAPSSTIPSRPQSPRDKLLQRYKKSASSAIHTIAEQTLHA